MSVIAPYCPSENVNRYMITNEIPAIQSILRSSATYLKPACIQRKVSFARELRLHNYVDESYSKPSQHQESQSRTEDRAEGGESMMTEEMTVLSSVHGKARRELRDITKFDLQSAVKYGKKERGFPCPKTHLPRWKYVYRNVVYITDWTSKIEVTSYKEPVHIEPCPITDAMRKRHEEVKRILEDEPQLCTTHSVIIIDQSASMKTSDVNGFRNRSHAAYGTLALDFIAGQLYERGDDLFVDAVTIIEMNDQGNIIFHREPLDWILFNKILQRQSKARPRSHGNYSNALDVAGSVITVDKINFQDLDEEDHPSYMLIFLSDGKPSDKTLDDVETREFLLGNLVSELKSKLSFYAVGLSAKGSDFSALESMAGLAKLYGAEGKFSHTGLSSVRLSEVMSHASTTMTTMRSQSLGGNADGEEKKEEKDTKCIPYHQRQYKRTSYTQYSTAVQRWRFDYERFKREYYEEHKYPWKEIDFANGRDKIFGFKMDEIAFGKGAERLAFRFFETDTKGKQVGKMMVAKESKYTMHDELAKLNFHSVFCRVQNKASHLAKAFNYEVGRSPTLRCIEECFRPPKIEFLDCHVYSYWSTKDRQENGVLVEPFLKGKFTKFNGNNGYVNKNAKKNTIDLVCGEVLTTDFIHAFSHWTYVNSNHKLIVCDLQGTYNEEGRFPSFTLTDPVICSKKGERFGKTDRRMNGIKSFCHTHQCSKVCKGLGLPPFGFKST